MNDIRLVLQYGQETIEVMDALDISELVYWDEEQWCRDFHDHISTLLADKFNRLKVEANDLPPRRQS